jgi:GTP-binding protein
VHLVDVSDSSATEGTARPDPVADFRVITAELKSFDPALAAKPTILVAAKVDIANPDKLKKLAAFARRRKLPFYAISAVSGEGIEPLKFAIAELVAAHRPTPVDMGEPKPAAPVKLKPAYPPPAPRARGRAR